MIRPGRTAVLVLLAVLLATIFPGLALGAEPAASRVVVILAPYVTWDDITGGSMPATAALADRGTAGVVNPRSSTRFTSNPTQTHVALTISAGAPSAFDPLAPAAFNLEQRLEAGTAGEAYQRSMGRAPGESAVAYLGLARIVRANEGSTLGAVPGALGQAITDAGGATAAVGNSDGGYDKGELYRSRPAAAMAMDASGLVAFGDVSTDLLAESPTAPYGITTDLVALEAAYAEALTRLDVHGGPGMVVIDTGDLERAVNFAADASRETAEDHRLNAIATLDKTVAFVVENLPEETVVLLVSTAQVKPAQGPTGFGPVIVSGEGYTSGLIASPSTHRQGLMTDLDISATVLGILGVERPVEILGNAAGAGEADVSGEGRYEFLQTITTSAAAVETVRPAVQNSYISITVVVLLGCAALLRPMQRALHRWGSRLARAFGLVILLLLSIPVSATLMFLFVRRPTTPLLVAGLLALTTLLVWGASLLVERRWGSAVALAAVSLLSVGTLLTDQVFGAPLSFSGMFSYSPLLGARYYGLGNEGASIVVGGGLAGLALLLDAFRDRPWVGPVRRVMPLVLGALVVVISAAPFWGANVGVIAWGTVAFGILWLQLNGRKVTWRTPLALLAVVVLVVAAFSLYESLAGSDAQTHLGRAWQSAETGGVGELWAIVVRKAETNWRVLRATNWSILMIAILAFLGFMRWRPHGVFAETLAAYPSFAVAMTAALWGSLVGYFTEDSGIVIPALVMLYITGSLLHVMLSRLVPAGAVES